MKLAENRARRSHAHGRRQLLHFGRISVDNPNGGQNHVTDVIQGIQGSGGEHGWNRVEAGAESGLDEASEEDRFEETDHQRHGQHCPQNQIQAFVLLKRCR
jgi:hypothetical protein